MEYLFLAVFFAAVGSMVAWMIMLFSYREHVAWLDEITMGRRVIADLLPYKMHRVTGYSFACTFNVIARRTHPNVDFKTLPDTLKRPFRVMCVLLMISWTGLIIGGIWVQFV